MYVLAKRYTVSVAVSIVGVPVMPMVLWELLADIDYLKIGNSLELTLVYPYN
jgi:hypothetical protein